MKLKLKHLAPYLPYGLKAQDSRTKEVRTITLLHFTYDLETVGHNHVLYDGLLLSKHLPILRPLSDLTKEIEVNGEKFVPYKWLKENYLTYGGKYGFNWFRNKTNLVNIKILPYDIIEKLLEWHFDLFNLIDAGLAIDINTI